MKNKNGLKSILMALGISITSLSVTGCGEDDHKDLILYEQAVDDVSDHTSIDEILQYPKNQEVLSNVHAVEQALRLSERLHQLDLGDVKADDNGQLLSFDSFEDYLNVFQELYQYSKKENKEYTNVLTFCSSYIKKHEEFINEFLYTYGYQYLTSAAIIEVQSKITDAISNHYDDYQNISIYNSHRVHYNNLGISTQYTIGQLPPNKLEGLVSHIFSCMSEDMKKDPKTKNQYNASRNHNLNELLVIMKEVLYQDYQHIDTTIFQYGGTKEVPKINHK